MTEIERLFVELVGRLAKAESSYHDIDDGEQRVTLRLPIKLWDTLHKVAAQIEEKKHKPESTVETRLAALEKQLSRLDNYVDALPTEGMLRALVSKAVDDIDLDSYVDTHLRDKGVERYMDPMALRHEIEVIVCEFLAGAAALAKPDAKKFGVRRVGAGRD